MLLRPLLALAVAGCVPSRATVFEPVDRQVRARVGVSGDWSGDQTRGAVKTLLATPLDASASVRIALAQNRRLQAHYDGLGIAASAIAEATVLGPTSIDLNHKFGTGGGGSETELEAVQDVLALLQVGQRRGIANAELAAAQARAVDETVTLVAEVEMAFYDYVGAQEDLRLVTDAFSAADASATLIERQHAAGNTTDLALFREQEQRHRLLVEVKRATRVSEEARARFSGLMGLTADQTGWKTIDALPALPVSAPQTADLESIAQARSLESSALAADAEAAAGRRRYAIVRAIVPELGAGVAVARRDGGGWEVGPAIRIGIPLFDQQQGPRARARAEERRARSELAATKTEIHAAVLAAGSRLTRAFEEAHELVDVVVPLRKRVLAETVLQYNAMNASTFELLIARRDMVEIGRDAIEASRRYWNAAAEVEALRRGGRPTKQGESAR